jgi:hypothetical protein
MLTKPMGSSDRYTTGPMIANNPERLWPKAIAIEQRQSPTNG